MRKPELGIRGGGKRFSIVMVGVEFFPTYFRSGDGRLFLMESSTITSFIADRIWPYSSGVKNRDILTSSVAAMLEYSFNLSEEAAKVNHAIEKVLASGHVTADLKPKNKPATTEEVGQAVCDFI